MSKNMEIAYLKYFLIFFFFCFSSFLPQKSYRGELHIFSFVTFLIEI